MLLGAYLGGRSAWVWQANHYAQALSTQAAQYSMEQESAAAAALDRLQAHQARREALEARLQESSKTHWEEMQDAQHTQARLRDRLATADLRLSVLLADSAQGSGGGLQSTAGAGGLVHGAVRVELEPAHAQRIIAITDEGDRGLIALQACQAYVREMATYTPAD